MLDLKQIDLEHLVQALEDHARGGDWWLDPRSGEVSLRDEPLPDGAEEHRFVVIKPLEASELDREVREFVARVVDGDARELLENAFEERLREFPLLEEEWSRVHRARMRRTALEWLAGHGLVAREAVLADQIALCAIEWHAFQKPGELAALIRLLRGRELRTIVEIGTARGGTLYVWCKVADPDAVIVSVDLPGGRFGGVEDSEIPRLRSLPKRRQTLHLVRRNSHNPATESEVAALIDGRKIDFLMIDGDHSLEGVRQDFELYSPLVRRGGLIAFHDILPHPSVPECKVELLWRELKLRHRYVEFLEPENDRGWGQWGGIGVLFWKGRSPKLQPGDMDSESRITRLNWGCGAAGVPGWVNSDVKEGPGVDISCDIRDGFPLPDGCFDYIVGIHALPEIPYDDLVGTLEELRRVLRTGGTLRLSLPDIDKGIDAYRRGDRDYFLIPDDAFERLGSKLAVQMVWFGYSRSLFTKDYIEELLEKASFSTVRHCEFKETESGHEGITELDNRERESLFVEAVK